ncbi:anti-anti-sigma factor [Nitritalea halalkaliphila LW7]|uniref:Anti-sigma factor antagonist n=1 Tax=Nitritalea halalkaliphila LW7 TaxID=1189621 RepID=I5C984_9BACT|nr:STAS domain-containing protein [Nitritalea halalkaliphila]EIM78386.1 anti-anti-sigma factor [Nitritalea halalkaliphila LW7]
MRYAIEKKEDYVVFTPQIEKIDSTVAPKLKSELLTLQAEGFQHLVLDLSQVKYADSSGLSALLVGNREFRKMGGVFIINGVQDHVMKLIKISMLDQIFMLSKDLEEAGKMIFIHMVNAEEEGEQE